MSDDPLLEQLRAELPTRSVEHRVDGSVGAIEPVHHGTWRNRVVDWVNAVLADRVTGL